MFREKRINRVINKKFGLIVGGLLILSGLLIGSPQSPSIPTAAAYSKTIELSLPVKQIVTPITPLAQTEVWRSVKVKDGDTLDSIFRAQSLSIPLLHKLVALNTDTKQLTRIRAGQELQFLTDGANQLLALKAPLDQERNLIVYHQDGTLRSDIEHNPLTRQVAEASATIHNSLFLDGQQAGLSDNMIMKLANLFGWDIDFVLDIRAGDRFHVIYEQLYRQGEYLKDGDIIAATFINQGDTFRAFRFETEQGVEYFADDGRNMKKAFLRAPLKFSSVNSNFNPKRMHPVLKRVRPHNGVDYGAPVGTPVYATGDGKVIRSAYDKLNGHHVFVQHANSIVTKYLHFKKRAVKNGQRVRQGQVVGYLGGTGRVTGAHLHYEFVLNGVHRNPRTVKLPKADSLRGEMLTRFKAETAPLAVQLARLEQTKQLAGTQ